MSDIISYLNESSVFTIIILLLLLILCILLLVQKNRTTQVINNLNNTSQSSGNDGIFEKIKSMLETNSVNKYNSGIDFFNINNHSGISSDVYYRLLLRYAVLDKIKICYKKGFNHSFGQASNGDQSRAETPGSSSSDQQTSSAEQPTTASVSAPNLNHTHNLAVTDLFVEKAIAYLELQANKYYKIGFTLSLFSFIVIACGVHTAYDNFEINRIKNNYQHLERVSSIYLGQYYVFGNIPFVSNNIESDKEEKRYNNLEYVRSHLWIELISSFIRGFTFYGLIVLLSVILQRIGKAALDQSERLFDKRHALRQGRLFVHLSDGHLNIEHLEKAFTWNNISPNAFGEMLTEAKAPWGNFAKDATNALVDIANNFKSRDKTE